MLSGMRETTALPAELRASANIPNPRATRRAAFYPAPLSACLDAAGFAAAEGEITAWPGYRPTPLVALDGLARSLGLAGIWLKDEAWRLGLDSFKALGGAYAVQRLLAAHVEAAGGGAVG